MVMLFEDRALKYLCAVCVRPGGILGIPPAHGRSLKLNLMGSGSPNNNMLIYSLAWPQSCPNDGVHRQQPLDRSLISLPILINNWTLNLIFNNI
jgi:hypothetical protein